MYSEIYAWDADPAEITSFAPQGGDPVRRPGVGVRDQRARGAAASLRDGRAGARDLLRHADHGRPARRRSANPPRTANSGLRRCGRPEPRGCSTVSRTIAIRRAAGARCVDESRRPCRGLAARIQSDRRRPTTRRLPRWRTRVARLYGLQFHPEVTHTLQGRRDPAPLRARDRGLRGRAGRRATSSRTAWHASARKSVRTRCCWGFPAASTLRCWPRSCTVRSARSSLACSSITGCCGSARAIR